MRAARWRCRAGATCSTWAPTASRARARTYSRTRRSRNSTLAAAGSSKPKRPGPEVSAAPIFDRFTGLLLRDRQLVVDLDLAVLVAIQVVDPGRGVAVIVHVDLAGRADVVDVLAVLER